MVFLLRFAILLGVQLVEVVLIYFFGFGLLFLWFLQLIQWQGGQVHLLLFWLVDLVFKLRLFLRMEVLRRVLVRLEPP